MAPPKGHPPYNKKGEGGKPLIHTIEFIENEADALIDWINDDSHDGIFVTEFASRRGYSRQRFVEFAEKSNRFSDALKLAKEWQEEKLIKGGLLRTYDAGFTKFIMPRLCGDHWRDVKNVNVTSSGPVANWIAETEGTSKDLLNDR